MARYYLQLSVIIQWTIKSMKIMELAKKKKKRKKRWNINHLQSITINISPSLKSNIDTNRDFQLHITKQEIKRNPIKLIKLPINQNFQRSIISIEHSPFSTRFTQSSSPHPSRSLFQPLIRNRNLGKDLERSPKIYCAIISRKV